MEKAAVFPGVLIHQSRIHLTKKNYTTQTHTSVKPSIYQFATKSLKFPKDDEQLSSFCHLVDFLSMPQSYNMHVQGIDSSELRVGVFFFLVLTVSLPD